jgi:hypothetical protein
VMAELLGVFDGSAFCREKPDVERVPDFVRHGRFSP